MAPSFAVVERPAPGTYQPNRMAHFNVNHPDMERARAMAAFILDVPTERIGLVPNGGA